MNRFADLLQQDSGLPVAEQQAGANRRFPDLLAVSGLHLWKAGDPLPVKGKRILLGIAPYARLDLQLLDLLSELLGRADTCLPRVEVFNILDCRTMEDFDKYVSGIGKVYQTPVVGIWEEGVLKEKAWGKPARDLIAQTCGLDLAVEP